MKTLESFTGTVYIELEGGLSVTPVSGGEARLVPIKEEYSLVIEENAVIIDRDNGETMTIMLRADVPDPERLTIK